MHQRSRRFGRTFSSCVEVPWAECSPTMELGISRDFFSSDSCPESLSGVLAAGPGVPSIIFSSALLAHQAPTSFVYPGFGLSEGRPWLDVGVLGGRSLKSASADDSRLSVQTFYAPFLACSSCEQLMNCAHPIPRPIPAQAGVERSGECRSARRSLLFLGSLVPFFLLRWWWLFTVLSACDGPNTCF